MAAKAIYASKYTDKKVSQAQIITEKICEKIGAVKGWPLTYKFWNTPRWKATFRRQIVAANQLLAKFSSTAILKALESPKSRKIYSLAAKFFISTVEEQQALLDMNAPTKAIEIEEIDEKEKPRPSVAKGSKFNKLKEL